ncbi:hypothetical protein FRC12_017091 [Ceratobasidium sp. 428]|nr:hypothetical protein FRC12_017091 [Ceratobasidium sp. 428]
MPTTRRIDHYNGFMATQLALAQLEPSFGPRVATSSPTLLYSHVLTAALLVHLLRGESAVAHHLPPPQSC